MLFFFKIQWVYAQQLIYDCDSMKKTTKKLNTRNSFYMKGGPKTEYKNTINIDFQPQKSVGFVHQSMKELQKSQSLIPTFNQDVKIYTPTFRIPSIQIDEEHYFVKFQQKLAQYEQIEEKDIMVPRPRNKDYCNVCQVKFADYLEHSSSKEHTDELSKNKFQKRIERFCKKFHQKYVQTKKMKDLQIQKNPSGSESHIHVSTETKKHEIQNIE